jgi:hypothetical protein
LPVGFQAMARMKSRAERRIGGERTSVLRNDENAQQTEDRKEAATEHEKPNAIPYFSIGQIPIFVGVVDRLTFNEVHEAEKSDETYYCDTKEKPSPCDPAEERRR